MANGVVVEEGRNSSEETETVTATAMALFTEEELREMSGVKSGGDYIEVTCGCTSHRYGDAVGRLRVFLDGHLEIICECTPGCDEGKMTPAAFEKHSGRETARKWKNNVWVIVNGVKVPLSKTVLLKYYNQSLKGANGSHRSQIGRVFHRDEFVRCSKCNKERRFRLRTKEECRIHHDSVANASWKCADMPFDKLTCDDEEERASRKVYRGCSRSPTCKGCTSCVCFGCEICRFSDCSCQTCIDFTSNAKA
ncbi:Protein ULTRAPETALA 1 [Linum perenne]